MKDPPDLVGNDCIHEHVYKLHVSDHTKSERLGDSA